MSVPARLRSGRASRDIASVPLYRGYAAGDPDISGSPLRGVPPTQVQFFWKSGQLKCEAAVLAGFLRVFHALPTSTANVDPKSLPSVPRGERLVRAYKEFSLACS
jgi:hypothetical protein